MGRPQPSLKRQSTLPWPATWPLRLCLDRILSPRKDRPVTFTLPWITSAQDAAKTISAVLTAVAVGELTPAEAGEISRLIEAYVKAFETAELAERLERLERMTSQ